MLAPKWSLREKYLALSKRVIRDSGEETNFQACLPTIAILKVLRPLKLIPPNTLGTERRSQDSLCVASFFEGQAILLA